MLKNILIVFLGGGAGSALRYLTSALVARHTDAVFPFSIFTVNMAGCLVVGLIIGICERYAVMANTDLRLLLITGFCGGYTTFSAFAAENFALLQNGNYWTAAAYIAASVIVGIVAVWIGVWIGK